MARQNSTTLFHKVFLDFEFLDNGKTIIPVSLGMVDFNGEEFYIEYDFDPRDANAFVRENVIPHLESEFPGRCDVDREEAATAIVDWVSSVTPKDHQPQFWGYYVAYDWVCFAQHWGPMINMPESLPWYAMDIMHLYVEQGCPKEAKPPASEKQHHALEDAKWNRQFYLNLLARKLASCPSV